MFLRYSGDLTGASRFMFKRYPVFTLAYGFVFLLVLSAEFWDWTRLNFIIKPCVSLILLAFLFVSTRLRGRFHQRLFTGLLFALAGDTLLMLKGYDDSYFLYGMLAFLICHLFYISAFYLDFLSAKELDKKGARIAISCCAIIFTGFYFYIRPYLPMLKLPVLLCVVIGAMLVMMAAFRNERVNRESFKLVLSGVIIFIITDAVMAQVHFVGRFKYDGLLVSALYMIAQYLIVSGGVERKLIHQQTAL